ncbi:GlsB/YeaQ/YmgE family stress response membrane protein [Actinomadura rubrisoli]|uniref:GlsB/YeaQ/YmgE family stress response membrane protein n=1 Tax=Actinomadura rubrisoli TaxID=2530368 RepID=A0A4R5CF49_9ACTN|nr:GlsB/YeaQ/YmgE family stress response membrane protein [Actinomadura rubrisoli]TDD95842.1 GlsB/YeaQ/YmgE family stress response membrane protein [Actinomadura rubrisoli]
MTIEGGLAAIVLGVVIGVLGRLIVPGRRGMPVWLPIAAGVAAAFAGTGLSHMVGLERDGWDYWETAFQIGFAAVGASLAAAIWPEGGGTRR